MKYIIILLALAITQAHGQADIERNAIDVPPILEEYGNPGKYICDMADCVWVDANPSNGLVPNPLTPRRTKFSCADKTRFLMTAEDGSKHCIALRNQSTMFTTN